MTVLCGWHELYFGAVLILHGDLIPGEPVSHGICPRCADLLRADIPFPPPPGEGCR